MARSTIHIKLLHQAGKWTCLSKTQLHHLHTRYMAPLRRILGQHKPPEPGTHRMRDDEILQTLKVPPLEAQLAVDKLRLAAQISTSQQALCMVVSSAGTEWREELVQALELVAVVMKDKLASLPRPRVSPHIWEEFWNKWPGQWATLLRIFLARTAAEVAEFGKKAQGTVHATDGCERDQEWLCMQCGKWFPSRAARIGHQGAHGRDPTRRLAAGSRCPVCRTEFHLRERLRRHLRHGTRRCVQAAREGVVPVLPVEDAERLDAAEAIERKRRARAGICRMWGPALF